MRKLVLVLTLCVLAVSMLSAPSGAAIDPGKVPAVWDRLTKTAGLTDAGPVHLEDKKEPNAWVSFSLNKYSVHATTGLLATLNDENELAGVLSHEIGHIKLGHYKDTVTRSVLWALLYKVIGDQKVGGVSLTGAGLSLAEAGFSREQEIEADDFGVHLAARAGYDPWGLYNSFQAMKKAGFETSPSGFNSHPPTERRLQHVRNTTISVAGN